VRERRRRREEGGGERQRQVEDEGRGRYEERKERETIVTSSLSSLKTIEMILGINGLCLNCLRLKISGLEMVPVEKGRQEMRDNVRESEAHPFCR
jgi:hypothetical protein